MTASERLAAQLNFEPRAFTRAELVREFSRHSLDATLLRARALRVAPGVYVGARWRDAPRARLQAASLWAGSSCAIGGTAALAAFGVRDMGCAVITVVARRANRRNPPPNVRVLRLSVPWGTVEADGIRTVEPVDAVIQAWPELARSERIGTTLDAIRRLELDPREIAIRLGAYPRVRGRRALEALLAVAADGVTSFLEHRARTRVFSGPDFRDLSWQVPVRAGTRRFVVDAVHRASGVALELDGRAFHGDDVARRRDIERDALLAAKGLTVIRFTYEDVMGRPEWCRRQVLQAITLRMRASTWQTRRGG
jgi:very-short-patch-repair endonuclease